MAQTTKRIQLVADGLDPKADTMNAQIIKADGTVFDPNGGAELAEGAVATKNIQDDAVTASKVQKIDATAVSSTQKLVMTDGDLQAFRQVPAIASRTLAGLVKQAATLAPATKAAGDAYTKAELDALVDKVNNLIAQLKTAGIMANQ